MLGRSSLSFIHPDDQERAIDLWMECLARPGVAFRTRVRHRHLDGRWIWLELSNRNRLAEPGAGYVDCEMFDISDEMQAHEAVRASERLLRELTGSLPVGVAQFDDALRIIYANERLYGIVGAENHTDEAALMACLVDRDGFEHALRRVFVGGDVDVQIEIDRLDGGGRRKCTVSMRPLTDTDGAVTGGVLVLEDVTQKAAMQAELEHRASYDALTGCVNRHSVLDRMTEVLALRRVSGSATGIAAIFVDLDDFKSVNDNHGHAAGDALLVTIAERLRGAVRGIDLVGRLGGDEFLVVCPDVVDEDAASALADRVSRVVAEPVDVGGAIVVPTASVGVAWSGARRDIDADTLIAEADGAMYRAKHSGGTVVLFPVPDHPDDAAAPSPV